MRGPKRADLAQSAGRSARVTSSLLSVNEWVTLRAADLRRRRARKLSDAYDEQTSDLHERALQVQAAAPKMRLADAIAYAELTDPRQPADPSEHGGPPEEYAPYF